MSSYLDFAIGFVVGAALAAPIAYFVGYKRKIAQAVQADAKTVVKADVTATDDAQQIQNTATADEAKIAAETADQVIADVEKM